MTRRKLKRGALKTEIEDVKFGLTMVIRLYFPLEDRVIFMLTKNVKQRKLCMKYIDLELLGAIIIFYD